VPRRKRPRRPPEPLPPPLPPERRTVGQLVAETVRFYRAKFFQSLPLGIPVAVITQLATEFDSGHTRIASTDGSGSSLLGGIATTLALGSILMPAAFVGATALVGGVRPTRRQMLTAYAVGVAVFLPAPLLAILYYLPAVAWLALVGLAVPAVVIEGRGYLDGLVRGVRLARNDYLHALGSLVTLAVCFFLTRLFLFFMLQNAGEATERAAAILADLVLSPILFIGGVLLYYDQAARQGLRRRRRNAAVREADRGHATGPADAPVES
jgi:hypothetical protein